MGRNEMRSQQQELIKNREWFAKLPVSKKQFIGYFIEQKTIENDNIVAAIMDKCFLSSLDDSTDLDILTMKKIISEYNTYLEDYKIYLEKEGNEGFNMIENEELRNKAKVKIKEYINGKMDKAKGLKLLRGEFNLPNAELSDLWIDCKTEGLNNPHTPKKYKKEVAAEKEEKKVKEIPKVAKGELEASLAFEGDKGKEFVVGEEIPISEKFIPKFKNPNKPKLEVVDTIQKIKGTFGIYSKGVTGVKFGDKLYSNKFIVEEEINALESEYNAKISMIEEEMEKWNKKLKETQEESKKELEKYAELEEVFNL